MKNHPPDADDGRCRLIDIVARPGRATRVARNIVVRRRGCRRFARATDDTRLSAEDDGSALRFGSNTIERLASFSSGRFDDRVRPTKKKKTKCYFRKIRSK